ncbi:MAG: polyhydroxyalkanoate granule-associated phasin [Dokdonella sp.]|uniref:polyhydroxyalkanoate granule-associated phasin n=1 Tax=Dokdonella sp. TaxID=2291710 RepID=UPI002C4C6214|nr:polyhydroxyalkanoate granule-associated phasin [Dokdonella sp.]HOX71176.1 hypothetical protein [Dokdonella sp.]HPG93154.1 hypothetical protein [Dokdonella sp.]HPN78597.1 hypothetical protein [Dokdonella sp.]
MSKRLTTKCAELAVAAPEVIAHRFARMTVAGWLPSVGDQRELDRMISEKQVAFSQAWIAMAAETFRVNQAIATSWFGGVLFSRSRASAPAALARKVHASACSILDKGIAPVHRTTLANAKRLRRRRTR